MFCILVSIVAKNHQVCLMATSWRLLFFVLLLLIYNKKHVMKMDGETSQQYENEVVSSFDKTTIIPGSETTSGTIGNEQNSLTQYWHRRTIILLFLGIMASYCCVFTVGMTSPLIMKDLNLNESQLAYILTVARSVRIFPKLFSGLIVDIFGGRNMFLLSHLLTCLFTLLFSYGHSVNYLALMWTEIGRASGRERVL